MSHEQDHAVRELGRSQLTLRRDLVFTPQTFSGRPCVVIEDPLNSKFHRVGAREYAFISLLDGRTPVSEALRITASTTPGAALSEHEAASICKWLVDAELAGTAESASADRLIAAENTNSAGWLTRWNPLSLQLPIVAPDRFFAAVTPWLGWMFSRGALVVWLVLLSLAAYQVWGAGGRVGESLSSVMLPSNWFWLALCWVLLKCVHELGHGVACKKYGGAVRVAGLTFILLAPVAYVDVTSSWRFRSKWQRMLVAAAGIYIELFVAAAAALVWRNTGPGLVNHVCLNLAVMASVTTLLFNANPLMRFDGYYVLSDLLEIPNLSTLAQQWLSNWARKYLLGMNASAMSFPPRRGLIIRAYAVAALVWRVFTCAGLLVAAATMFHGAGIVLAGLGIVTWIARPLWKLGQSLLAGKSWQRPKWGRVTMMGGGLAGAFVLLFYVVPWPGACRAPAVVEFAPLDVVRAGTPGFVRQICVVGGQEVSPGDVLVVLQNQDLEYDLANLKLELRQSELASRASVTRHKLVESQTEQEKAAALRKRIAEKEAQVAQLTVRAGASGQVVARELDNLLGTYLRAGDEILTLGTPSQKELQVSIEQDDLDSFAARVGEAVDVRVPGFGSLAARLAKLEPRANSQPKHTAICAPSGGPLAVRKKEADPKAPPRDSEQVEFLAPRFSGTVELSTEQSQHLPCGRLAYVSFRPGRETVGMHLYNQFAAWLRERLKTV